MHASTMKSAARTLLGAVAAALAVLLVSFAVSALWARSACARGAACRADGVCGITLLPWPSCAAKAQGCRESDACKKSAACSLSDSGSCKRLTDADCAAVCEREGRCLADEIGCKATEEGCARSTWCRERGACRHWERRCQPGSDADCSKTERCRLAGACTYDSGLCRVQGDAGCIASEEGRVLGGRAAGAWILNECQLPMLGGAYTDGACDREAHCSAWGICAGTLGACKMSSGHRCDRTLWCSYYGRCTPGADGQGNPACVAASELDLVRKGSGSDLTSLHFAHSGYPIEPNMLFDDRSWGLFG